VLAILGWLCIVATVALVGFGLIWMLSSLWIEFDAFGLTVVVLEAVMFATFGVAIGLALLIGARACRPNAKVGRFRLWARLLLLAAVELSLVFPLYCYTTILYEQILGHGYADPLDPALLGTAALAGSTPFLMGIVGLVVALIWGRRKPEPDIPAVFS
jgi:hypothetical protein